MNAARTLVIPNGVPVDLSRDHNNRMAKERRIFLSVGSLTPQKNPLGLIRSFAAMRHKDCELWLAGDGFLRHEVEQEIAVLGLKDRVRLLGVRQDVPQLLEQADCFVMASLWEGLPMAILEAGAKGLPVISPPVGAVPTVLSDDCGFVVEVSELHHALDAVIDDYAEARRRGMRLRAKVLNNYSLEHMSREHADLYISLLLNGQS
jgi:glycosyltransferase involved in cell wall biosynthesis